MSVLVSVIIDNYNYEQYLGDAIESVLNQTYPFIEIIVVDDGSSDGSRAIINDYQTNYPEKVFPIFKANGGQASAFNAGVSQAKGEILCFLDSDDTFEPHKVEAVVAAYQQGYEYIFNDHQMVSDGNVSMGYETIRYPYNVHNLFLVYDISKYVGDVTSTLSLSKKLAKRIFPILDEEGWRIQADDVIVFSAAMLGQSLYINEKLTKYRIHSRNGYYNQSIPSEKRFERLKRIGRVKTGIVASLGLDEAFFKNTFHLVAEFKTHRIMDQELLKLYSKVLFLEMDIPFFKKLMAYYDIVKVYLKRRRETC